ncbi:hypothetical protein RMATCC62417_12042 [Rhizopus microsporus]|nr:hypothetical protein RMATCC62417_12042 [Rhizopus microsporus]
MTEKGKYLYFLLENHIFDNNDKSDNSQVKPVPESLQAELILSDVDLDEERLEFLTTEALELDDLKTKLNAIEKIVPQTKQQRVEKGICRFILDLHVHKEFYLNPKKHQQVL